MLYRSIAPVLAALALTSCAPHPGLRYVEVDVYHYDLGPRPLYFEDSSQYLSWRRRQAEISGDMRFHHGCYPEWCGR